MSDFPIAIIGAGFAGIGTAIRLLQAGIRLLHDLRARRRDRRHLARQHLSGRRLRRAVARVLALLRAVPGLDAPLLAVGRDPGVPARPRREVEAARRTCGCAPRSSRRASTRRAASGRSPPTAARRVTARVVVSGVGGLVDPALPDIKGTRELRRRDLPHRALEPRLRAHRQARRRDRHRRERRAGGAVDRAARSRSSASSSARRRGSCRRWTSVYSERARRRYARFPFLLRASRFLAVRDERAAGAR